MGDRGEAIEAERGRVAIELADWRRRVAELYARVRTVAATDPETAWDDWRATREWLYREHPQSPLPAGARASFRARHFAYDPRFRFELPLLKAAPSGTSGASGFSGASPAEAVEAAARATRAGGPAPITFGSGPLRLPSSAEPVEPLAFDLVGWLAIRLPGADRSLGVFRLRDYGGGLFLPLGDATNGVETYGAGRYVLDTAKGADLGGDATRGTLVVDLNFAFQPSCAFDPRWACPLAPAENRLDVPVRAGERLD